MNKTAIIILADPKTNSDDALGRLFNALVLANDLMNAKQDVIIFFQGAATRWIKILQDLNHPAHGLFMQAKPLIKGASNACANVFGAAEDIKKTDCNLLSEFEIPGIGGATSIAKYLNEGYSIITF